jgi:DNA-binding transcriptional regulator YhcF (GntR family)
MESNKDAGEARELTREEMIRVKREAQACATEIAKTMFKHSSSAQVSVLASMMVAAGGARATGLDKHSALDMFLTFYNDATNFMMEE